MRHVGLLTGIRGARRRGMGSVARTKKVPKPIAERNLTLAKTPSWRVHVSVLSYAIIVSKAFQKSLQKLQKVKLDIAR